MNLNLIAAILLIAAVPGWALAQSAVTDQNAQHETNSGDKTQTNAPSAVTDGDKTQTKAPSAASEEDVRHEAMSRWAEQGFEAISGDSVQTQNYCDIVKLHDKIKQAYQKGDITSAVEIGKHESKLAQNIDPKAFRLIKAKFSDKDLMAKLGLKPDETMEATIAKLDGLCEQAQQEPDDHTGAEDRSGKSDDNR
jgi:hypothetical protein